MPKYYVLLDNQSTHDTFYNCSLLKNIREAENLIHVSTNAGVLSYTQEGMLPGYGWVYYNPDGIANIISMSVAESKGYHITYNTHEGGCFKVINPFTAKVTAFKKRNRLFIHDVRNKGTCLVNTVEENKLAFTTTQYRKALETRNLYQMIGTPSAHDFKTNVQYKMLPNANITGKEIDNAQIIFGKELGSICGKMTQKTSTLR